MITAFPRMAERARHPSSLPPQSGQHEKGRERGGFHLRVRGTDIPLAQGRFVIGRSPSCDFQLDGHLVSRQHAAISVGSERVMLEDLGSRNGIFVNGVLVRRPVSLQNGDRIRIGSDELQLVHHGLSDMRTDVRRTPVARADYDVNAPDDEEMTARVDTLELMSSIVDRAVLSGNAEEAESLVAGHLSVLLGEARQQGTLKPNTSRAAASYALKLAATTGKSAWVDYVFELYLTAKSVIPLGIVHELFNVSSRARAGDKRLLRRYMEFLKTNASELGFEANVVLQRLERFERL